VTTDLLESVVSNVPDEWLGDVRRADYVAYLSRRLEQPRTFVGEAESARDRG
jgi:hypothetical protein